MSQETTTHTNRNRLFAGIFLILIGAISLTAQFWSIERLILPALAVIFLAWGLITRNNGFLIPGGILAGIGAGIYLIDLPFVHSSSDLQGGIFLLAFAGGWLLISLTSLLNGSLMLWPLIPSSILALIGAALLAGGPALTALEAIGKFWPLSLIAVGIYIIVRRSARPKDEDCI